MRTELRLGLAALAFGMGISWSPKNLEADRCETPDLNRAQIGRPSFDPEKMHGYNKNGIFYSLWLEPLEQGVVNVVVVRANCWPADIPPGARIFHRWPDRSTPRGEQSWLVRAGSDNERHGNWAP